MMVRSVIRMAVPKQCHQDIRVESDSHCFNRTSLLIWKTANIFHLSVPAVWATSPKKSWNPSGCVQQTVTLSFFFIIILTQHTGHYMFQYSVCCLKIKKECVQREKVVCFSPRHFNIVTSCYPTMWTSYRHMPTSFIFSWVLVRTNLESAAGKHWPVMMVLNTFPWILDREELVLDEDW